MTAKEWWRDENTLWGEKPVDLIPVGLHRHLHRQTFRRHDTLSRKRPNATSAFWQKLALKFQWGDWTPPAWKDFMKDATFENTKSEQASSSKMLLTPNNRHLTKSASKNLNLSVDPLWQKSSTSPFVAAATMTSFTPSLRRLDCGRDNNSTWAALNASLQLTSRFFVLHSKSASLSLNILKSSSLEVFETATPKSQKWTDCFSELCSSFYTVYLINRK